MRTGRVEGGFALYDQLVELLEIGVEGGRAARVHMNIAVVQVRYQSGIIEFVNGRDPLVPFG